MERPLPDRGLTVLPLLISLSLCCLDPMSQPQATRTIVDARLLYRQRLGTMLCKICARCPDDDRAELLLGRVECLKQFSFGASISHRGVLTCGYGLCVRVVP